MSRSRRRTLFSQSSTMASKGFCQIMYILARQYQNLEPNRNKEEMAAFISLLSEVHCVPFIPCSFTTGFDGIVSIAVSTMPALVEAVKTEKPYFLPRFEKIDWRNLFGIPIPEVDIEVNRPSDSGASSMSTVPVEKSNNLAAIDETNSSECSPNTSGSTSL